ncbi:21223_t:CDS:2 [Entrophospora sp. SA101]|nr:21223_t:CDS:2 [Entrophospora sp. SA101]
MDVKGRYLQYSMMTSIMIIREDTLTISIIKTCQFFSKTKSVKDEEFGNYAKESANKAILTFLI